MEIRTTEQVNKSIEVYDDNKLINVADAFDACDWLPAVTRSTHWRVLTKKARCGMYELTSKKDVQNNANMHT